MGDNGTLWLPEGVSTLAPSLDALFYFVLWVSTTLFAGVVIAMAYFAIRYRRRHPEDVPIPVKESKLLEITWIIIPTILVLVVFTWGFRLFIDLGVAPPNSYEIQVRGKQWLWEFEYPNGAISTNELRVPIDRPVKLIMSSTDVIHSFFVPVFRVKHDVLPNRYTSVWFQATRTGEFDLFCTEYCGTQHSGMIGKVIVMEQGAFNEWLQTGSGMEDLPLPELGEVLFQQQACFTCHSTDGSAGVGPTLAGVFGSERQLEGGETVIADENYLRESILQPQAKIVQGFLPVMPASYSALDERQIAGLIAYIESLQ